LETSASDLATSAFTGFQPNSYSGWCGLFSWCLVGCSKTGFDFSWITDQPCFIAGSTCICLCFSSCLNYGQLLDCGIRL